MNCEKASTLALASFDRKLSLAELVNVWVHRLICGPCRAYRKQLLTMRRHIGHLDDLTALDELRLREFLTGVETLSPADLTNAVTEAANHNSRALGEILAGLRYRRSALVHELAELDTDQVQASSEHPRLGQPMRLIDWAEFVADHDNHHLARARAILEGVRVGSPAELDLDDLETHLDDS